MNQTQNPTPAPKSNLKWLLIVLAIVIIGGVLVYFFYIKKGSNATTTGSTPSPTATIPASPTTATTSPTAKPSGASTVTPQSSPTSAVTPTPAPPAGYKLETNDWEGAGNFNVSYSVFIKDGWREYDHDSAHGPNFYTSNSSCNISGTDYTNCWDDMLISAYTNTATGSADYVSRGYDLTDSQGGKIYVFINKNLSQTDQEIIFSSFKVGAVTR